jgi:hypothetical protein
MKKIENLYVLLGGSEHLPFFEHPEDWEGVSWFWTCLKNAKKGETAYVYLNTPVSRIVGKVEFVGEPFHNTGDMFQNQIMRDKWCVRIGNVKYFENRPELTIRGLRALFPEWGWLRYPRTNTRIPDDLVAPLEELFKQDF